MSGELEGKIALITGGAGGLGAATARAAAAAGAMVLVADLSEEGARATAESVGGEHLRVDVSRLEENERMLAWAAERCGGVDLVHLNAGVTSGCGVGEDFDIALYRRAMSVNLDGVVFGVHAALPVLRARGGGSIVATASLAGLAAVPLDPIYAANKHAVVGLVRSAGPALVAEGIRLNAVCPGYAESAMVAPFRDALIAQGLPIIPAETVADTVVRVWVSEASGECWYVQAGREPEPFRFRGIPGPRDPAPA